MCERSEKLLPKEPAARARATQWPIAALNWIEPHVMNVALIDIFYSNEEWAGRSDDDDGAQALHYTDLVSSDERLKAYLERCTSRPAFKRALHAQIADFRKEAA